MEIKFNLNLDDRLIALSKKIFRRRVLLPLGALGILFGTSLVFANVPHVFTNGQLTDANQINENFKAVVPVGSVIPWHKTMVNPTGLSDRWVECNGQTLDDPESPLHGQTIPDLNGATDTYNNQGLFVRGGSISGNYQEDQMQSHKHDDSGHQHYNTLRTGGAGGSTPGAPYTWAPFTQAWWSNINHANLGDPTDSGTGAGTPRHGPETRPVNMSMVWIMRIK